MIGMGIDDWAQRGALAANTGREPLTVLELSADPKFLLTFSLTLGTQRATAPATRDNGDSNEPLRPPQVAQQPCPGQTIGHGDQHERKYECQRERQQRRHYSSSLAMPLIANTSRV